MKKFGIFLFSLLGLCEISKAQDAPSKLSIDVFTIPTLSYKFEKGLTTIPDDKMKLGFSFGTLVNYHLSEKFVLSHGLEFLNRGFSHNIRRLVFVDQFDEPLNQIRTITIKGGYNYLTFLAKIGYVLKNEEKMLFTFFTGFGVDYLAYIRKTEIVEYTDNTTERNSECITISDNLNRLGFSFNVNFDMVYKMSEKWNLLLSPDINVSLTPLQKQVDPSYFKTYFWNTGLKIGIRRNL